MKDNFNREIDYLRISVTDLCDLRCKYCMSADGVKKLSHQQVLSPEKIKEIVTVFVKLGIKKVRITGGEPLVRKGLIDIIKYIKEINGIDEICITTNGIKLKQYAKQLKDSGIDRLNISLDTLDANKFHELTRIGNLDDVLSGIEEAKKVGFENIKINTVLIGGFNDNEIENFINFAACNSLTLRFIELMPIGESTKFDKEAFLTSRIISVNPRLEFFKDDGVSSLYRIKDSDGYIGLISPLSHKFCSSCNRMRLTADGKLKPCLHSSSEIDVSKLNGDELKDAIIKAIKSKPKEHHLESGKSDSLRDMSMIGG